MFDFHLFNHSSPILFLVYVLWSLQEKDFLRRIEKAREEEVAKVINGWIYLLSKIVIPLPRVFC